MIQFFVASQDDIDSEFLSSHTRKDSRIYIRPEKNIIDEDDDFDDPGVADNQHPEVIDVDAGTETGDSDSSSEIFMPKKVKNLKCTDILSVIHLIEEEIAKNYYFIIPDRKAPI